MRLSQSSVVRKIVIATFAAGVIAAPAGAQTVPGAERPDVERPQPTIVMPLTVPGHRYIPPVGSAMQDLRGCVTRMDIASMNQRMTIDDETDIQVRAEVEYRLATAALDKATPMERKDAEARFKEAERKLADVQEAMRLGQGVPIRQIVEAKAAERNAPDGVDGIYTPNEFKDLRISTVVAQPRTVRGRPVLHVTGRIHNPRTRPVAIPPLWFAAIDASGETVKTQQSVAQKPVRIAARGSVPFTFDFVAPAETERTAVTFAPRNRLPLVQPYGMGCEDAGGGFRR